MATYKAKISLRIKGFKRFWTEFKRSKRGLLGLVIIIAFIAVGIIGPLVSPYDALFPAKPEYYPAGKAIIADVLAKPVWYKYLPGGSGLSENMKIITDHEFSSEESMNEWNLTAPSLTLVKYNRAGGDRNDGCLEISYKREADASAANVTYVRLTHDFTYPYQNSPRSFWIHISYRLNGTVSPNNAVTIELLFHRTQQTPLANYTYDEYASRHPEESLISYKDSSKDSSIVYTYPLDTRTLTAELLPWNHAWIRSTMDTILYHKRYWLRPQEIIFPTAGSYTYEIRIGFHDKGTSEKDVTVYLDNLDMLIYGEVYGVLGTDYKTGSPRDIATSMVYGARISIFIGLLATAVSVGLGLALGLIAGYIGGAVDEGLMRFGDFLMCLPGLPLTIVLMVVLSSSIWNVILILSFLGWMGFARQIRSVTLSIRERAFIEAAKASGAGRFHIIFKHILPNVFALVYLTLAVSVPGIVLAEASLSWLGLYDPTIISWGRMLFEFSRAGVTVTKAFGEYWFWVIPPGVGISLLAIAFILVGYALDEILNPKLRARR